MLSLENADKVTHSANSLDQADQAVIVCCRTIASFFILTFTQAGGEPEVLDILLSENLTFCMQSCSHSNPQEALKTDSDLPHKLIGSHAFIQYSLSSCLAVSMPRGLRIRTLNNLTECIQGFCLSGDFCKKSTPEQQRIAAIFALLSSSYACFFSCHHEIVNISLMWKLFLVNQDMGR